MPLTFDTAGLRETAPRSDNHRAAWVDEPSGDVVILSSRDQVPDLPAALGPPSDLVRFRRGLAEQYKSFGCLVEADVVEVDGVLAAAAVVVVPERGSGRGVVAFGSLTVPFAASYLILRRQGFELGDFTGVRVAVATADCYRAGIDPSPPHPYAPRLTGRLPYLAAYETTFDDEFPDDPISRVRPWLHRVIPTVRLDPSTRSASGFAPTPPRRGSSWWRRR